MTKYVFLYHAPSSPADATPMDPAQVQAVLGEWMEWAGKLGDQLVDFGTPLDGGVRVTSAGESPGGARVGGYSIIDVPDRTTAVEFARIHPHLQMPGDGVAIEVHEAQAVPGT
jgi:hypothetical protein